MDSNIKIFENAQFGQVRTAGTSDEPFFCLADICRVLETKTSDVRKRLPDPGVVSIKVGVQTGVKADGTPAIQQIDMTFVNEANLYRVIMRSDKPQAEAFQDWVCGEVLPSIRKRGGYMAASVDESPEQIMARALLLANDTIARKNEELKRAQEKLEITNETLKVTRDAFETSSKEAAQARQDYLEESRQRLLAQENAQRAQQMAEAQAEQNRQLQPYADYAKEVLNSDSTFTMTQVSKDLNFRSVHTFIEWLCKVGVIFKQSGTWMPTSKYSGKHLFATRTNKYVKHDNTIGTRIYTVITEQGRAFLHAMLQKKGSAQEPAIA